MIYQMKKKLYIIVLNYRRYRDTASCIRALLKSDLPTTSQIIVVDNSQSRPGQKDLLAEFGQKISLVKNKRNLGFAAGNNVAIRSALADASQVLIINPDVLIPRHFFRPLLGAMKKDHADIVAPAIRHRAGFKILYGLEGRIDWGLAKPQHTNLSRKPSTKVRKATFVTFACVLISAQVFSKIGLLDEKFFMYLEDVDFCLRLKKARGKIICVPGVIVDHETSSSFAKPVQKLPLSFRSHLYFITKWLPWHQRLLPYLYTCLFYPYLYLLWSLTELKQGLKIDL